VNLAINGDKTNSVPDSQFSLLDEYMKPWERAYPRSKVRKVSSIESALELAKKIGAQENALHVLITGSLHVVGEALRILGR
jgi:folylpolyglutamate synthase/dihydropteroate synthase